MRISSKEDHYADKKLTECNKVSQSSYERLILYLETSIGREIHRYLSDETIVEVYLNDDGKLWIDKLGQGREYTGINIPAPKAKQIIEMVASGADTICNEKQPLLSAELPGSGNRFQGTMPPAVINPVFNIRKKAIMIFTLDDYVRQGIMSLPQQDTIIAAVKKRLNILVVGGTGSGKTTLVNAILNEIATTKDRVVIIEDTMELQCSADDKTCLRSSEQVTMNELLKGTMRMRPDRIVVGEVRGGEALTLLKAWNTGHPGGCATVHANSARGGLIRLEQLIQEVLPSSQRELIAEAVNMIIYIERHNTGRKIKEIVKVGSELNSGDYVLENIN